MMEKRRRTRINNCLSELKTLVLKALKKDVSISYLVIISNHVISDVIKCFNNFTK